MADNRGRAAVISGSLERSFYFVVHQTVISEKCRSLKGGSILVNKRVFNGRGSVMHCLKKRSHVHQGMRSSL